MRCDSPPLRVLDDRFKVRYVSPTSNKNRNRSRISFKTSFAIIDCLLLNLFSMSSNQPISLSRFISLSSAIFFSSTLNHKLSFFNLLPPQVSQVFNSIYFSTHSLNVSVLYVEEN